MTTTTTLAIGDKVPSFDLPDTNGQTHRTDSPPAPATVIIFTCNHCPYVIAWNDRLRAVAEDYQPKGVRFLQINSNDPNRYPADSFQHMRRFVRATGWPIPYLHDEPQDAARAFGAQVTPHVYLFDSDGRLAYIGAPDDSHEDPSRNASWLREALDSVMANEQVQRAETPPRGCSIKWKG